MVNIYDYVSQIHPSILTNVQKNIVGDLNKCGLFFRTFNRNKSAQSIERKINEKKYKNDKKMQDLLGFRIVLYFKDDIPICEKLIKNNFKIVDISKDITTDDTFKPIRLNYVCAIPEEFYTLFPNGIWEEYPIDKTLEIQIRTVFSEGWHEVEHDLRYKCQEDWSDNHDLSRYLNGIFATLETCDWSMINIFEQLAYKKYKEKKWESMLRNKLRIRFEPTPLSVEINKILNENIELSKAILKIDREQFMQFLSDEKIINIPKTVDNIVNCINGLYIGNEELLELSPQKLNEQITKYLTTDRLQN